MKRITTTTILIIMVMMSGTTCAAVLEEDWAYGKRNVAPDGIEHAYWDFENGAGNLLPLNNQHPDIAVFLPVTVEPNPDAMYAVDYPSSVYYYAYHVPVVFYDEPCYNYSYVFEKQRR